MTSYLEKLKTRKLAAGALQKLSKGKKTEKEPYNGTVKTAKRPFYSKCSTRVGRFSGIKKCLHDRSCRFLVPRDRCEQAGESIYNLTVCPLGFWFHTDPERKGVYPWKSGLKPAHEGRTTCPARCKVTSACYGRAYFDHKPGKAGSCIGQDLCPWQSKSQS